jgi:hypothetical protein
MNGRTAASNVPSVPRFPPGAGFRKAMQCMKNAHRRGRVQTANIGLGLFRPGDPLHAGSR